MVPEVLKKVKILYLCGDTADKIEQCVTKDPAYCGKPKVVRVRDIAQAVELAHRDAAAGDIVTLSPACASFDAFPNFAARGNYFKELVMKLS